MIRSVLLIALVALLGAQASFRNVWAEPGKDDKYTYKSVCIDNGKLTIQDLIDCRNLVAVGRWRNAVNASGWTFFEVETHNIVDAGTQAYAAGYLEGVLSKTVLSYHIHNTVEPYCKNFTKFCDRLNGFLNENQAWVKGQLDAAPKDDVYWNAVNTTYYQISGLIDGYEGREIQPRIVYDLHPIYYINMNGDFYDLEKKLNKTRDPAEPEGHCSGFVKVAPGNKDLFISQVTMSGFQNMLRVLKLYKFAFGDTALFPGYGTTFASYPGLLYSSDDFAITTAGLAVIETTISVFNTSLFEATQSKGQLLTWVRAVVSNLLARDGREWCTIYSQFNSGTYNNQWIVLDYSKFRPNEALPDFGLLYVLEQLPGKIVYRDMSDYLKKNSYFASYNIPYFKAITETAGWIQQGDKLGDWFRWGKAPRARIFDRDHVNVVDLDSLTKLMRYNDYTHEPYSRCNCTPPYSAEAAISARGDLNLRNGTYEFPGMGHVNHGALDFKGTNAAMAKQLRFRAWGGPTYGNVPPFQWSNFDFDVPHLGHPDKWEFLYVEHRWETPIAMKRF